VQIPQLQNIGHKKELASKRELGMRIFKRLKPISHATSGKKSTSSSPQLATMNQNANISTSNLSSASTLLPESRNDASKPRPHMTDYEAYMAQSRHAMAVQQAEVERRRMDHAWLIEQFKKRATGGSGRHWPDDPWRGGFGPRANDIVCESRGVGMDAWLIRNGLRK
jgi:hypothetical protein